MKIRIMTTETEHWLILTPDTKFDEKVLDLFSGYPNTFRGEFEECQAGYMREFQSKRDLIIKFKEPTQ